MENDEDLVAVASISCCHVPVASVTCPIMEGYSGKNHQGICGNILGRIRVRFETKFVSTFVCLKPGSSLVVFFVWGGESFLQSDV